MSDDAAAFLAGVRALRRDMTSPTARKEHAMSKITPSVGRKVWYYSEHNQAEPLDATVIKVHDDGGEATPETRVNLFVVDQRGQTSCKESIGVGEEGDPTPHYRWMPYQIGQAGKA